MRLSKDYAHLDRQIIAIPKGHKTTRLMDGDDIYIDSNQDADMKRSIKPSDIWDANGSIKHAFSGSYSLDANDSRIHNSGIFSNRISNINIDPQKTNNLISKRGISWSELIAFSDSPLEDTADRTRLSGYISQSRYSILNYLERFELSHLKDISSFFNTVKCSSCNRILFSFLACDSDTKHSCCHKNHRAEAIKPSQPKKKAKISSEYIDSSLPRSTSINTKKKLVRSPPVLNLDKHCGVVIIPSNLPCMRSLTCKSHSVLAKRSVTGRSRSYDELLAKHKLERQADKMTNSADVNISTKVPNIEHKKSNTDTSDPLLQILKSNYRTPILYLPTFTRFGNSNLRHWLVNGVSYSMMSNRRATSFIPSMHIPFGSSNDNDSTSKKLSKKKSPKKIDKNESDMTSTTISDNMVSYSMPDIAFT